MLFLALTNLIFSILTTELASLQVNGTIKMENTTGWSSVSSGDVVLFTFTSKIDLTYDSENFLILIDGDTVEFYNDTSIESVDWTLSGEDGSTTITQNTTTVPFEEHLKPMSIIDDVQPVFILNFTLGIKSGMWSLTGKHRMTIKDDVSPGSLVRCVMTFLSSSSPYNVTSRTLTSNYQVVPHAEVTVENRSALTQPIMGIFSTYVTLNSGRDLIGSTVECFTPPEMSSKEVRLTVQLISVIINSTFGVTSNTLEMLDSLTGSKISSLSSYQNNIGILELPPVPMSNNSNQLVLTSMFSVRVEDYSQLQNGDHWPISMGVSFNDNVMWVSEVDVSIDAPEIRLPSLAVSIQQLGQCAYDSSTTATVQVVVYHSSLSTATAYNVTVNVYLPDNMLMKTQTYTEPRENSITVAQSETVVTAEITRLTFSDPFVLKMTLNLDLSALEVLEASNRIITAETIYNDRWNNVTDLMANTAYLSVQANKICSKPVTWTNSSTCQCSHNSTLYNCGCCLRGACPCGEIRPSACSPCDEMWRCVPYKKEFEKVSFLSNNTLCDAFNRRRGGASGVSCHTILSTNPLRYLEISPRVSVITGSDIITGNLLGVANNGLAYVISQDLGVTWSSILDQDYQQITKNESFVWASFS
ncbi:uncharacterized protein LOC106067168 [Biomphalaria glabrata]|uniref:Uncharacterized protein LOC106067168 n=1 Tax=Biomphalaria glabrata TaxID=6526 RepID=A0A9W3A797_BIOGL|nr:uncharacterized protein LOC106067168 [Biomphalaria glabrata]